MKFNSILSLAVIASGLSILSCEQEEDLSNLPALKTVYQDALR
ncbi:hypothetical protein [Jiulongibacter sp. NS-SX5]